MRHIMIKLLIVGLIIGYMICKTTEKLSFTEISFFNIFENKEDWLLIPLFYGIISLIEILLRKNRKIIKTIITFSICLGVMAFFLTRNNKVYNIIGYGLVFIYIFSWVVIDMICCINFLWIIFIRTKEENKI